MSESAGTASAAERWHVPALDGSAGPGYLTAGRLEALQKEAYDEAFQQGLRDGLAAGQDEVRTRALRFDALLERLARPFDELDETVEKHLVELAMTVVQQLFRRELRLDPGHVIGVVRESLPQAEGERAWTIVEDPMIDRGGCKVVAEQSQIDAQTESRLKAVIAAIVCDERR